MPETTTTTDRLPRPERGTRAVRSLAISTRNLDEDNRTAELAFSSETPVPRWWGDEVLVHDPSAVRMERLRNGAALLRNHRSDQLIGVVESARLEGDVARATVRFSTGARGEEAWQEVREGVLRHVSVGYLIHEITEVERMGMPPEIRITDWEPLEISLVSVPADASVGVGRDFQTGNHEGETMPDTTAAQTRDNDTAAPDGGASNDTTVTTAPAATAAPPAPAPADRTETDAEIRRIGARFGLATEGEDLILVEGSVADMRQMARAALLSRQPAPATVAPAPAQRITGGRPRVTGRLVAFQRTEQGLEAAFAAGQWARGFLFGDAEARRWCEEHMDTRAMAGSINSAGGVFVPDELADAMIDLRERYGVARQLCDVWEMNSDTLFVPRWTGDVNASFVGENEEITDSDPDFDGIMLVARKLAALTKIPEELIEDAGAAIMLADRVAGNMAWAFAKKEDECLVDGDGSSTYGGIVGLRPKIIDGSHTAGAVDAASGNDTLPEITGDDLDNVRAALPEYAEMGGDGPVWLMSKAAKNLGPDAITRAAGGNTMENLGNGPQNAYLGDAIVTSQAMPKGRSTDYSNLAMLFYGNFRMGASMGSRRDFRVRVLEERYAEFDQIGIKATERFDLNVHGLGDTSEAGPIVGLIGE